MTESFYMQRIHVFGFCSHYRGFYSEDLFLAAKLLINILVAKHFQVYFHNRKKHVSAIVDSVF